MHLSLRPVILATAADTGVVDVAALADAHDHGRARHLVIQHYRLARTDAVTGSPHLFLPDGTNYVPLPPPTTPASITPCSDALPLD